MIKLKSMLLGIIVLGINETTMATSINKATNKAIAETYTIKQTAVDAQNLNTIASAFTIRNSNKIGSLNNFHSSLVLSSSSIFSTAVKQKSSRTNAFFDNKRNVYSALWAFTSLNYIYADLVGFMDKNVHNQYHSGLVGGLKITPNFLASAALYMQLPLCNVFLPQIIKNEKTLRWVQIISGTLSTLVQSSTLFLGKPAPYYIVYSGVEIAATTFITLDAIRWKPKQVNLFNP
jgi:Family of unknown function (DUF6326)